MHPIIWLPLTNISDPSNSSPLEVMKKNKGIAPIYKSDITFSNVNTFDGCYGKNVYFDSIDSAITIKIGHEYGDTLWKKFSITFFSYLKSESYTEGEMFSMTGGGNTFALATISGVYDEPNVPIIFDRWVAFAFVYDGEKMSVYMDGELIKTYSKSIYSAECEITFTLHGYSRPSSIFNLKIYNDAISKRTVLNDYNCLLMHYKFDGSSSDDPQYSLEYDASGFENDADLVAPATITSTYSPSRQLTASLGGSFTPPVSYGQWCLISWLYYTGSSSHIITTYDNYIWTTGTQISITNVWTNETVVGNLDTPINVNEWFLICVHQKVDSTIDVYINGKFIVTASNAFEPMLYINKGVVSDVRVYMNKPSDTEIGYLYNRNVTIDENGTVYATELQEVDYMETFGFGDRGQIMSPAFESPDYSNQKGVMDYNYLQNKLSIRDFEEV